MSTQIRGVESSRPGGIQFSDESGLARPIELEGAVMLKDSSRCGKVAGLRSTCDVSISFRINDDQFLELSAGDVGRLATLYGMSGTS